MVKYFDKNCKEISEERWRELKMNKAYCLVGEFADAQFHLRVGWNGRIENAENLFRTSYPLFDTILMQYDEGKEGWIEAIDSGKTFAKLEKARDYYETFLMKYTESYVDEDGCLVEEGNMLADDLAALEEVEEPKAPQSVEDKPTGAYDEMVW